VTVPLIMLAIPSVIIGYLTIQPVMFGGWLDDSITVLAQNDVVAELGHHFHGASMMAIHALGSEPFWLMMTGFALATMIYLFRPALADSLQRSLPGLYRFVLNKYFIDELYQAMFVRPTVRIGKGLWEKADAGLIDGVLVNGSARLVGAVAGRIRLWQTGYLFQYAFAMIIGLIGILAIWVMY
jgi:NADH-quinone oxidoreductase subunit L